jgi:S1-C subfamily serine protease
MKYSIVLMLLLNLSLSTIAQVINSDSIIQKKTKEIAELNTKSDQNVAKQFQNTDNFKINQSPSDEYFKSEFQQIVDQKAKIKDPTETEVVEVVWIEPEMETNLNKRIITGPSQYDSRIEIRDLNLLVNWQQQVLINSLSVGIIIEKDMIHQVTDSIYQLDISSTLGNLYNLCPDEAFWDQPVIGVGTAFISDERTMITAAHVFSKSVKNYFIVFGFEMVNKVGAYEAFIHAKDIYSLTEIILDDNELDVTVFKVDRSFTYPPLKWANSLSVPESSSVYMIGHPMGLPKKAALNASMKSNDSPLFFYTSLDAFQGNSGSPVFRFDTHEVIGILVSGELDYKWNGSCNASTLCSIPYCKGEKVIRIEEIMKEINKE